jgi:hypothetical protein
MARNVTGRLSRLKDRRSGTDRLTSLNANAQMELIAKSLLAEAWQNRMPTTKPNTRYALGAMQEVGADYTKVSIETAERVGGQLKTGLEAVGYSVDFRLQGSVPANLHIRGVSDVDLLNLDTSFHTYATGGRRSLLGQYTIPTAKTSLGVLTSLRAEAEKILKSKFPAAIVDCTGGKAITISGGSLARPVDVVPSHWFDTIDYQASLQEYDRGVTILDKKVPTMIDNLPFIHIKRINERDAQTMGGLKKAIRLCKNVKNDAEEEGTEVTLPSFDIAAAMYHADQKALAAGYYYELGILGETQRFLDYLTQHEDEAEKLYVPDGTRKIFDTPAKLRGLRALSIEMDDLLTEVAKEQVPTLGSKPTWFDSRAALAKSIVPTA